MSAGYSSTGSTSTMNTVRRSRSASRSSRRKIRLTRDSEGIRYQFTAQARKASGFRKLRVPGAGAPDRAEEAGRWHDRSPAVAATSLHATLPFAGTARFAEKPHPHRFYFILANDRTGVYFPSVRKRRL